ncbi:mitogen-activated protein kinase kinase kinase 17-like [Ipomoea triloba]|uniref:mitogen-activated protein kinase kinase kinase 17-like n=1 Tax=Ipomoea triloba TaxID=35885 RepID=UPI00125CF85D|nr:mitogen-activated protein kinase kinase kinase 17-like [Ipomoea triloba]
MWWKKDGVIGFGSYGTVTLGVPGHSSSAWFPSPSCVAVKSADIEHSDSLRREEQFLYSLRGSPNFVHCYGTDTSLEDDGKLVYNLLLEYAAGGSLKSLIKSRRGEMSEGEVAFYAYQLLVGLSDLHAMGIVHCDLKPHNVLVFPMQQNGLNHLKIADFGLAIHDNNGKKVEEELSKKYGCRGTLQYASPESLYGVHKAPRDVWALGCITVKMITGKSVWGQYCNRADLMAKIETLEPKIPENVSVICKDFLNKCLNKNSEGRWNATRLMTHPFFLRNLAPVIYWTKVDCDYELRENPFGYDDQWVNNKDLFSTFNRYSHYDCMDDEEEYIC